MPCSRGMTDPTTHRSKIKAASSMTILGSVLDQLSSGEPNCIVTVAKMSYLPDKQVVPSAATQATHTSLGDASPWLDFFVTLYGISSEPSMLKRGWDRGRRRGRGWSSRRRTCEMPTFRIFLEWIKRVTQKVGLLKRKLLCHESRGGEKTFHEKRVEGEVPL